MPIAKSAARRSPHRWIQDVKTTAISVPEDTMTRPADEIADILLRHNRKKAAGSINRYIQFYINRAGRRLPAERRAALRKAMAIIRGRLAERALKHGRDVQVDLPRRDSTGAIGGGRQSSSPGTVAGRRSSSR